MACGLERVGTIRFEAWMSVGYSCHLTSTIFCATSKKPGQNRSTKPERFASFKTHSECRQRAAAERRPHREQRCRSSASRPSHELRPAYFRRT